MPDADFFKVNVIRDFSYFNLAKHKQQNIQNIVIQIFFIPRAAADVYTLRTALSRYKNTLNCANHTAKRLDSFAIRDLRTVSLVRVRALKLLENDRVQNE